MATYRAKRNQQVRTRKKAIEAKIQIEEEGELRDTPQFDKLKQNNSDDEESDSYRLPKKSLKRKNKSKFGQLSPVSEQEEDEVDRIIREVEENHKRHFVQQSL